MNKRNRMPERISDLDFVRELKENQRRILEDWMGVPKNYKVYRDFAERNRVLKALCLANLPRAQEGYDIIVRGVSSPKSASGVDPSVERRTYEIISQLIRENESKWEEYGKRNVDLLVTAVEKQLEGYAQKALAKAAENFRPIAITGMGKPRKVKGVLPPEFERMVQLASQRIPIMLVGPSGCGKTYLSEKLAEALGLEFSDQSCSEGMSESVFNGWLLPIGKGGNFEHVPSEFMRRYERGGVMLLDEMDAGDSNLFTYTNKAIANDSYTVAQRYTKPVVKKHTDFVLVAAANTYGNGADNMYVGRNQLDAATLDRFRVGLITMDYSREVEKSLADESLCEWAWRVRDNIRKHKLRRIMSTRTIKDLAKMTEAYKWSRKEWDDAYFCSWPADEKRLALEGLT